MKNILLLSLLLFPLVATADTPAPGTVKAKTYSGDGLTAIGATGSSLDVNVTNSGGLSTVDQGSAGTDPWPVTGTVTTTNSANGTPGSSVPSAATQVGGKDGSGNLRALKVSTTGVVSVDGSTVTQPVSGTFWQATQPVSGTFWQATQPVSGTVTANAGTGTFTVDGSGHTQPVSGTFWQATQPVSGTVTANAGTGTFTVDASGHTVPVSGTFWQATQPVSAASLPLPSGASTAVKQPALGTAGSPSSDVITVQGATSMTPFKTDGSGFTQPVSGTVSATVSGTVTANAGTGTFTVDGSGVTQPVSGTFWQATQPVSGTFWQATQPVSGTVTANAGTGTFTVDASGHTVPVSGTFWQATQPVSGTVTANIGTTNGLALDASVTGLQVAQASTTSGQNGDLVQGAVTTSAPSYTTGKTDPLSLTTAGALRTDSSATTQPVSGTFWQATQPVSGTFWQATQPISAASLPLPSGASTAAKQPALGTAGTASSDVITVQGIASMTALKTDSSATTQPVSGTFWQATQPVSIAVAPVLVAGSAIIGKVGIDQTTPGTTNLVALAANQSVNLGQVAGTTTSTGNGTVDSGTQRVSIASNNTAFSVNASISVPAAVTVKQAAVTIGTSAVRLTTDGSAPSSTRVLLAAQLLSTSTANCYFGSSGVTSSSTGRGVQMFAGQTLSLNNDAGDYYAICDTASQTFFITEQE